MYENRNEVSVVLFGELEDRGIVGGKQGLDYGRFLS